MRGRDADFLLAVEPNQPSLLDALRQAFDATTGHAYTTKDRGHGRHETRRARTLTDPKIVARVSAAARIDSIRCLCRIDRTRVTKDGIVTTVHYHISSRPLTPRQYARCTRSHWSVEAMHFVLDTALDEDACRIGTAAGTVGALRRLAYSVIADRRAVIPAVCGAHASQSGAAAGDLRNLPIVSGLNQIPSAGPDAKAEGCHRRPDRDDDWYRFPDGRPGS